MPYYLKLRTVAVVKLSEILYFETCNYQNGKYKKYGCALLDFGSDAVLFHLKFILQFDLFVSEAASIV